MRRKQEKFRENEQRTNVIQTGKPLFEKIKGRWRELYFLNQHKIVVELGCGRGEYTVALGQMYPQHNFIGVDIKGDRIWKGSKTADALGLKNVAFLRTQVQLLEEFFAPQEIDEIWITFPDPRPKKRDVKRRMLHPRFLEIYRPLIKPGGTVHLKTDNQIFFDYSLEVLASYPGVKELQYSHDIYQSDLMFDALHIKTHYEQVFSEQGFTIKYLQFQF